MRRKLNPVKDIDIVGKRKHIIMARVAQVIRNEIRAHELNGGGLSGVFQAGRNANSLEASNPLVNSVNKHEERTLSDSVIL